jgi:hypothetical protein
MVSAPQNSNVETLLRELGSHETGPGDELRLAILKQLVDDLRHEQFSNVDFLGLKIHRRALPVRYA